MADNESAEVWVQDLADRNLFFNRILNLKLPESALQSRPTRVLKIIYDGDTHPALPFGYAWNADGEVAINPVQADIIRQVFALNEQGLSAEKIAKRFEDAPANYSKIVWHGSVVREILKNERTYRSGLVSSDSSLRLPLILT